MRGATRLDTSEMHHPSAITVTIKTYMLLDNKIQFIVGNAGVIFPYSTSPHFSQLILVCVGAVNDNYHLSPHEILPV